MDLKGRKMVTGDTIARARLSQHLKDVHLIVDAAAQAGLKVPLSDAHQFLLEQAVALGLGDADNCAVIEVYRRGRARPENG
jgi:2-hydroxy-3-oxopropionate reductase